MTRGISSKITYSNKKIQYTFIEQYSIQTLTTKHLTWYQAKAISLIAIEKFEA